MMLAPNFQVTREKRANRTQYNQKKGNNKDQSKINAIENRKIEKVYENWFFESKKINKPLDKLIRKKEKT